MSRFSWRLLDDDSVPLSLRLWVWGCRGTKGIIPNPAEVSHILGLFQAVWPHSLPSNTEITSKGIPGPSWEKEKLLEVTESLPKENPA